MIRLIPCLVVLAACSASDRSRATLPEATVRAWSLAATGDDPRQGYELLSGALRKTITYERFQNAWRETKEERASQATTLLPPHQIRVEAQAQVTLADGVATRLVHEEDGWHLEVPLLSSSAAATPQDALRMFAASLSARNWEKVLLVLTQARRDGLRGVADAFLEGLKTHMGGEIEVSGDRAFLRWTEGKVRWKVVLLREGGEWRVDDVDMQ